MSEVTNNKLVTGYNGCININVLGKVIEKKSTGSAIDSLTVGDVAYFTVQLGVIEKGTSVDMGTIYSKQRNTADNFKCDGKKSAKTRGEVVTEEKTIDFTVDDDYNWAINNIEPAINKSVLASMLEGKMFLASPGSVTADGTKDKVVVVGFQGVSTNGAITVDQDFKYFGLREGLLIDPNETETDGSAKLITNTEIPAFFDTPMISIEGIWTYAGATKKGFGSIYNFCTTHTFNEGTGADPNQLAFSLMRMADVQSKNLYTKDGITDAQSLSTIGTNTLYRASVDFIEYSDNVAPTLEPVAEGQTLALVDTTTGGNTLTFWIIDTGAWLEIEPTMVSGTLAFSNYIYDGTVAVVTGSFVAGNEYVITTVGDTDFTLIGASANTVGTVFTATGVGDGTTGEATPISIQNSYVACKSYTSGTAVAVDFGSRPILPIYDWSFANTQFEVYSD